MGGGEQIQRVGEQCFSVPPHYNLFHTLRFGRMGRFDPTYSLSDSVMDRAFWSDGHPHRLRVERMAEFVRVTQWGYAPLDDGTIERYLGLHRPALHVGGHAFLEQLSQRYPNIFLSESITLGHDLVRTVMQQLIEWKDAASAWNRWVKDYGHPVAGSPGLMLPPSLSETRGRVGSELHGYGISKQRVGLVREIGRLGERIVPWVKLGEAVLRQKLLAIPRLGPWTADHFMGFSLNCPDVVPLGDYQLPHTVAWALKGEMTGNDASMIELLRPWTGQRWLVLRLLFAANIRSPRRGPRLNLGRASRPRPVRDVTRRQR